MGPLQLRNLVAFILQLLGVADGKIVAITALAAQGKPLPKYAREVQKQIQRDSNNGQPERQEVARGA
jgi:hypothetical protein